MKILTWNIKGDGLIIKKKTIKKVVCKENPYLIVLHKVKKESIDRAFTRSI